MTPDERRTWAYGNLDRWLEQHEQGQFFDAIDGLGWVIWELGECPTHGEPGECCDHIFKGSKYNRSITELAEVIDATATAFLRQAS